MSADNMIGILQTDCHEFRVAYVTYPQLENNEKIYEAFKNSNVYNHKTDAYIAADFIADREGWENLEYGIRKIKIPENFSKLKNS